MDEKLRIDIDTILGFLQVDMHGNFHPAEDLKVVYVTEPLTAADLNWIINPAQWTAPQAGMYAISYDADGAIVQWLGPEKAGIDPSLLPPPPTPSAE